MGRLLKKVAVLAFLFFLIGVSGLLYLSIKNKALPIQKTAVHEQKSVSGKDVSSVAIDTATADVRLTRSADDTIQIGLTGDSYIQAASGGLLEVRENGDALEIKVAEEERFFDFGPGQDLNLQVALPEKIFDRLRITTQTGDVESSQPLQEKRFKLDTATGDIEINGFTGEEMQVSTSTGDMRLLHIDGGVEINTATGSVEELSLVRLAGNVGVETSTGDVVIRLETPPAAASLDVETNAGDLSVTLDHLNIAHQSERQLKASIGSGGPLINVRSSTGDISISQP
ncbi:DUF4097 domain-containing protein [Brevibacillus sp. SYP-B805]|uniref:DUF4097 family beta strand repeat-containing protein n=1 Tax=Brevibacillus sp. SYP-B805 TaxID=1578199 RepID=UPI0013EB494A|nr:DUF4097 family beta strand repeat-containing protein [Brevibacillus sp. SYP-B805]NGQ94338.1 DUF4097 domain-containing protein [Brevibacillus sp. SYP-B805]